VWPDDPLPSEGGGRFDRNSGDPLPEDLCAIFLVLGEEELPAREADHSSSDPAVGQEIGRLEGDVDLAAGGDQNDVVTVPEDVASPGHSAPLSVKNGDVLAGLDDGHRTVPTIQRHLPGLDGLGG